MLAIAMASLMFASSDPAPRAAAPRNDKPIIQCREVGSASSRSEAIVICRTKEEWLAREACNGATRYCSPEQKVAMRSDLPGRETTFPMTEDNRIVCRKLAITGSRLRSTNICLSQREWRRMYDDTQTEMKELQNSFSKRAPF